MVTQMEQGFLDEIMIKRRVKQRGVLSPCLFNLHIEIIFCHVEDMKRVIMGGVNIVK